MGNSLDSEPCDLVPDGYSTVLLYHGTNPSVMWQCDGCGCLIANSGIHTAACPAHQALDAEREPSDGR